MNKIKKNDTVMVIAGKEKGKTSRVLRVIEGGKRVVLEKLNMVKRHTKPSRESQYGGIVDKEAPMAISNVMMVTKDGHPTRVSIKEIETQDGKTRKVRFSRKYNEILD